MFLSPLLRLQLRPTLSCWAKQSRNIRPSIKISKDKFQLEVDVRNFNKDEICVKARPEFVVIEGKQEKKTKKGFIMRQFIRKFKLPQGCVTESMESKLSAEGILTITATRKVCEESMPCETLIPISPAPQTKLDTSFVPVQATPVGLNKELLHMKSILEKTGCPPKIDIKPSEDKKK